MAPWSRSHCTSSSSLQDYIFVRQEIIEEPVNQRRITDLDHDMSEDDDIYFDAPSSPDQQRVPESIAPNRNTSLKGHRRFIADLEDLKKECDSGFVGHGFRVKSIQAGVDEGSIELIIKNSQDNHVLVIELIISDTSDYPEKHSFFSYASDPHVPPQLSETVERFVSGPSRTIRQTISRLLSSLPPHITRFYGHEEPEMEDEDSDIYYGACDVDDLGIEDGKSFHRQKLQHDFAQMTASNYRPGLPRFGGDGFVISASLSVATLASSIPPHALMAWDRRLLSPTQHLTLLISGFHNCYPPIDNDGTYSATARNSGAALTFRVGLTTKYKPNKGPTGEAGRTCGLAGKEGRFDRFSLSNSLESLLGSAFLKVVQIRRKFRLGWSGAERLFFEAEKDQLTPEVIYDRKWEDILKEDMEESQLECTNSLPHDPLAALGQDDDINLPLTAFSYLVRRLSLCTRYCMVCHNKLETDYEALKPYVCDSKLCTYQYYLLNQGPSLEYEIMHNSQTVDLLVSLAYSAASEGVLDEPLPVGLGLRVRPPGSLKPLSILSKVPEVSGLLASTLGTNISRPLVIGADGLCNLDDLDIQQIRASIVKLIDMLPPIESMKIYLEQKVNTGELKPNLRDLDKSIPPAAWSILRWCTASCTAYLQEITYEKESIKGFNSDWRQFKFSVGAPDAEAKFKAAVQESQLKSTNANTYPSLYAFHGSPLRNWHSIIRHGLWYKSTAHGRKHGNGVYLSKDAGISMGNYAEAGHCGWKNSRIRPTSCVALAEIVNLPAEFVSSKPHFVIKDTHWIMCRYLLVKGDSLDMKYGVNTVNISSSADTPLVQIDPAHPVTLNLTTIQIPDPTHQIYLLLQACIAEYDEDENSNDVSIITSQPGIVETRDSPRNSDEIEVADDGDDHGIAPPIEQYQDQQREEEGNMATSDTPLTVDWKHDMDWVNKIAEKLMTPPVAPSRNAMMAIKRELRAMLWEQENTKSLKELGWFMPPGFIDDNLTRFIVEMHSFDETLPIAKDLETRNINSVIFEIQFTPSFPLSPPIIRIVAPRFLPFDQGGGGCIMGGSINLDLLTADGWLPSYSISAVLVEIKLAISKLDPRPARLASNYHQPYEVHEATANYNKCAATHGWKGFMGLKRLIR